MSTVSVIHLKSLRLSCAKENLRLFITPTLELSYTAGTIDHLEPSDIIQALKSSRIWLSRGLGCHINIRISFNGASLQSLGHEDAIEELGTLIREAALWSQLSLSPSLEIPNREVTGVGSDICIKISHTQPPPTLVKGVASPSIIPGDVKPPEGVPCIGLISLDLALDFHSVRKSPVKRRKRKRLPEMLLDHPDFTDADKTQQLGGLQTETATVSPSGASQHEKTQDTSIFLKIDEEKDDEDALLLDANPTKLLTPPSSAPQNSCLIISKHLADISQATVSVDGDLPVRLDLPVATKLIDVGLRTLIGGRQIKATPGVTLLKPDLEHTLSELAPSLWSPGYLKAVSQRSRFLPIISRTLSTSLLKNVQSSSLRAKLSKLAELQPSPLVALTNEVAGTSDEGSESMSHKIAKTVQARLWKMTQKSLHDPVAARRLQSISLPPDGAQSRLAIGDLLANESNATGPTTFSCLADDLANFMEEEFEDFLGEEDVPWQHDLLQDSAESERSHGLQDLIGRRDAEDGELPNESLQIPDEFWEDLRLEEEGGGCKDETPFIPEEFWDDLLAEEREGIALGAEDSNMLI